MNYFAHGLAHVDRPYFLAGTALPDWLSAVDRGVRVRARTLEPLRDSGDLLEAELAAGARRHLDDDAWFHATRGFAEVTGEVTHLFRRRLDGGDGFWCGFLGHVTTELLIDAALAERYPARLNAYYAALAAVDAGNVAAAVQRWTGKTPEFLPAFIELFRSLEYLRDYADNERLLVRLNQVLGRVKLAPLPPTAAACCAEARRTVRQRLHDLLPDSHYHWPE